MLKESFFYIAIIPEVIEALVLCLFWEFYSNNILELLNKRIKEYQGTEFEEVIKLIKEKVLFSFLQSFCRLDITFKQFSENKEKFQKKCYEDVISEFKPGKNIVFILFFIKF